MASKLTSISHLIGTKFNRLTINNDLGIIGKFRRVNAICECGKVKDYRLTLIKNGQIKSCGCLNMELFIKNKRISTTHNLVNHPLYSVWLGIRRRCYDKKSKSFIYYGAKGVIVCDEWMNDFKSFYIWAIQNGYKKGLQLDKDKMAPNRKGKLYCPEYCCFITIKENQLYKKNSFIVEHKNESKCLTEWCQIYGIKFNTIRKRIKEGWSVDEALTIPIRHFKKLAS